jgi:hypothetical protein
MHALRWQRVDEHGLQAGPMHLVVRGAEGLDDGVAERRAEELAAVVPAPLLPRERAHAEPGEIVCEPEAVQDA